MNVFQKLAENLEQVKNESALNAIFNKIFKKKDVQEWIIDNIQNRLYDDGESGTGKTLKTDISQYPYNQDVFYSDYTVSLKSDKNQKTSHVTLSDTEQFYDSMKVVVKTAFAEITADFNKPNGKIYDNFTSMYSSESEFNRDVLTMSAEDKPEFISKLILPYFIKQVKQIILKK